MSESINRVGVIGAGVMGVQLAALLAGAGAEVELLDLIPGDLAPSDDARGRDRLAMSALAGLSKMKPSPLFSSGDAKRIRAGNIEDHLGRLSGCDWVIESVVERADIKRSVYSRLDGVLSPDAILSSNTSGILRETLVEGMRPGMARRFLVTHFFNPPRHMKLLEIVPGDSLPEAFDRIASFAEKKLGKGVVKAKDTPLFVANRIGVFYVLDIMHRILERGWPIEAVDAVLSRPAARPRTGVFRTVDMAGIDTLTYVAAELVKGCPKDEGIDRCRIPQYLQQMVVRGLTGDKSGRGFYWKDKGSGKIQSFDPANGDFRPRLNFSTPSLLAAARIADPAERLRRVVFADDQAGEIAWPVIARMICYSANRIPEIADDIYSIDQAMRWGYRWELGPFETWDALGAGEVARRLEKEGQPVPALVESLLRRGHTHFYEWRGHRRIFLDVAGNKHSEVPGSERRVPLRRLKEVGRLVEENPGASVVDVGEGIFACEFHTKMNAIDPDVVEMLGSALDRTESEGRGLLVANEGEHFSAGANLLLILMAARQKRWDEIDTMVREFQSVCQRMRFFPKPVMAVPFGIAVGGGLEICLACNRRTASMESYMGLVEIGAGVIPAGGGCKNLLLALERRVAGGGPQPKVSAAFELIASGRVSASAREAAELGFLSGDDKIVMDDELLLWKARSALVEWSRVYEPPQMRTDISLPGRGGEMALASAVRGYLARGKATDYDAAIALKLARVLAGGYNPTMHETTEEHILDLERETFLSLVGEEKTQERIAHLLKTGKPLGN